MVPVFEAVAKLLEPYILKAVNADSCKVERHLDLFLPVFMPGDNLCEYLRKALSAQQ